ncbi:hypothetical protein Hypma_006357 [Hypsizygus marmoreus]|uniref:Uncharacterized protein n=1 Tax=Hypsizygus marmoreus TaxID=39966 RepID=A0A369JVA5_HYPMA|nr:hypothetical protein Hypma_006357 [Hypsizygus marmoreus]
MPGANYMGGKRNAAKARSRDATGRIQKGFFGRRRFDMLSKGLASKGPVEDEAPSHLGKGAGDLGLSLAHARNHTDFTTPVQSRSVVLPPKRFPPATPKSKWSGNSASTSSGKGHRSSRVLDVLDTFEPIFRRATLNRILALPDLAGLSGRKKRCRSQEYHEEVEEDDPFVVETPKRQKIPRREPSRKISHMHTPDNILLSPLFASAETSSRHPVHSVLRCETRQGPRRDWDEEDAIDFSDFETRLPGYAYSPEGTTSILGFSPMAEGGDALSSPYDPSVNDQPSSRHDGSQSLLPHDKLVHLDAHGSQTFSSLPPSSEQPSSVSFQPDSQQYWSQRPAATFATPPRVSQDRIHSFPLDNLYEHEDPWHTIGVILGLSPVSPWSRAHALEGDDLDPVSLPHWTKRSSTLLATDRPQPPEQDQDDPLDIGGGELTLIAPDFSDCGTEDDLSYIRHLSPGSKLASSTHSKIASAPEFASSAIAECRTPSPRGGDLDIQEEPAVLSASKEVPFKVDIDNIGADSRDNPYLEEPENSPTKAQVGSSSPSRTRNSDIPGLTVSHEYLVPCASAFATSDPALDRKELGGELGAGSERLLGCSPTASETPVAKNQETSAQKEVLSSTAHSDHDLPGHLTSNLSSDVAFRQSDTRDLTTIPSPLLTNNEAVQACLEEINCVFQGPCLFPEDWDESEVDD